MWPLKELYVCLHELDACHCIQLFKNIVFLKFRNAACYSCMLEYLAHVDFRVLSYGTSLEMLVVS